MAVGCFAAVAWAGATASFAGTLATPIESSLRVSAGVSDEVTSNRDDMTSDTATDSQLATLEPLSASASVALPPAPSFSPMEAQANASATWTDADRGELTVFDTEVTYRSTRQGRFYVSPDSITPIWSYTFRTQAEGEFLLDFDIALRSSFGGANFGLFWLRWTTPEGTAYERLSEGSIVSQQGSVSRPLEADTVYTAAITHNSYVQFAGRNPSSAVRGVDAIFRFHLVPEPSALTLALFALTFGKRRR